MIVVVADDFTGAAEIGAIGFRYGLNTEVQREFRPKTDSELIVIDTDTRSSSAEEARRKVGDLIRSLREVRPEWIYKKVDSVMRGHILSELTAMMEGLRKRRALLVPANPSLGRTISKGIYFVKGVPLSETDFSTDPEYPAASSDVLELLGDSQDMEVCFLSRGAPLPSKGVAIGEVENESDLLGWAGVLDEETLPAGGSDFFRAILRLKGFKPLPSPGRICIPRRGKALFVCGSSSPYSRKAIRRAEGLGVPVCRMPQELFQSREMSGEAVRSWAEEVLSAFERNPWVIAAIDRPVVGGPEFARRLRRFTSALVEEVLGRISVEEIYIEGGATASSVLHRIGWIRFRPCEELAPGVARMRVVGVKRVYLTVKPGSYQWPEDIWTTGQPMI